MAARQVILAVDPGFSKSGTAFAALGDGKLIMTKKVRVNPKTPRLERIYAIGVVLESLLVRLKPALAVIEEIPPMWKGRTAKSTQALSELVGALEWICRSAQVPVRRIRIGQARQILSLYGCASVFEIEDEDERAAVTLGMAAALEEATG